MSQFQGLDKNEHKIFSLQHCDFAQIYIKLLCISNIYQNQSKIRPQHKTQQQPQPSLRQLMRNFKYWNTKIYLANFLFEHFFITQMLKNWLALNFGLELIKEYWVIFGLYIIYFLNVCVMPSVFVDKR